MGQVTSCISKVPLDSMLYMASFHLLLLLLSVNRFPAKQYFSYNSPGKIKDQALHTYPYNLQFLNSYLKELCIHLNGGRQQLDWSPHKGHMLCPWQVHTARFFQSLSLDCQSEITMLQAARDQSTEHQIVLWGFSNLSVPWSPSAHSLSWWIRSTLGTPHIAPGGMACHVLQLVTPPGLTSLY